MLFLLFVFILLNVLIIIFIISDFKIEIQNLKLSSVQEKFVQDGYIVIVGLYIKKASIIKFEFNQEKLEKINVSKRIEKMDFKKYVKNVKPRNFIFKKIKKLKLNIEQINLKISLDTIDPILTSYVTAIISSFIGVIFGALIREYNKEKQKFVVEPAYINKNLVSLNLSCIISIKIWNIIKEIINERNMHFKDKKMQKFKNYNLERL